MGGDYTNATTISYTFEKDGTFTMTRTSSTTRNFTSYSYNGVASTFESSFKSESSEETTETKTGTWAFMGKTIAEGFRKNERVALTYRSTTTTESSTETYNSGATEEKDDIQSDSSRETITYTDDQVDEVWTIVRLANKELKALLEIVNMPRTGEYTCLLYTSPSPRDA